MYSFSFAIQLMQAQVKGVHSFLMECDSPCDLRVEVKDSDQLFFYGDGFRTEEDATRALVETYLKVKVALLRLKLPHRDWISLSDLESKVFQEVANAFKVVGIAAHGFSPTIYETGRPDHWPLPGLEPRQATLAEIFGGLKDGPAIDSGSSQVLESLMILSAAIAAPSARVKVVLSVTAIEVLIERAERAPALINAVDILLASVASMELIDDHRKTLNAILEDAKREGIGVSGKKLVSSLLGGRQAKHFYDLYGLRSKIVHGNLGLPVLDLNARAEMEQRADEAFKLALELALSWRTQEMRKNSELPTIS